MPAVMMRDVSANGTPGTTTTTDVGSSHASGDASGSFAGRVRHVLTPQAALTVPAVYRAVGLIARTEGQFMLQYQIKSVRIGVICG